MAMEKKMVMCFILCILMLGMAELPIVKSSCLSDCAAKCFLVLITAQVSLSEKLPVEVAVADIEEFKIFANTYHIQFPI
ncbi:conserved hypothetical protein [Ricinus communis]|uniref:Uncharacterized protein n=1 Tax=Ricinus communis TaxID=3988 RepID=B9REU0_RICCO|nr:conserved hypothetical protein [Ricinus communis]